MQLDPGSLTAEQLSRYWVMLETTFGVVQPWQNSATIQIWDSPTKDQIVPLGALMRADAFPTTLDLYVEAVEPGGVELVTFLAFDQIRGEILGSDVAWMSAITVDLDVDTNRDEDITEDDDLDEDTFSTGAFGLGAIVLPNADNDNGGNAPDNWHHGVSDDFDLDSIPDDPNRTIDGAEDLKDIAPLWIRKLGIADLPDDLVIRLSVSAPAGESAFFAGIDPEDRVRIFLPTEIVGPNHRLAEDADSVIGPEAEDYIEFSNTTADTDTMKSYDLFKHTGVLQFGVEGIEIGAGSRHHAGGDGGRHAARIGHGADESGAVCAGG